MADRAVGELAYMYARLGRMTELDALLKSIEGRVFSGPATERIAGAREGSGTCRTARRSPSVAVRWPCTASSSPLTQRTPEPS